MSLLATTNKKKSSTRNTKIHSGSGACIHIPLFHRHKLRKLCYLVIHVQIHKAKVDGRRGELVGEVRTLDGGRK